MYRKLDIRGRGELAAASLTPGVMPGAPPVTPGRGGLKLHDSLPLPRSHHPCTTSVPSGARHSASRSPARRSSRSPRSPGASTCSYVGSTKSVDVFDSSGTLPLRIATDNGLIIVKDGPNGTPTFCGGSGNIANVGNTDAINVFGPVSSNVDGLVVDESGGRSAPASRRSRPSDRQRSRSRRSRTAIARPR